MLSKPTTIKYFLFAAVSALMMSTVSTARAELIWNWSFNSGAEAGTFKTNGVAADLTTSSNFVIDTSTFTVTASAYAPSAVGLTYDAGFQADVGFLWDGTSAIQFYRSSGALTNGSNIYSSGGAFSYLFYADASSVLARLSDGGGDTGFQALTLSGQEAVPVSVPATLGLIVPALLGLSAVSRRLPARKESMRRS